MRTILLLLLTLAACSSSNKEEQNPSNPPIDSSQSAIQTSDTTNKDSIVLSLPISIESIKKIQEQEKSIIEWWLGVKNSFSQDNQVAITRTGTYKIILYTSSNYSEDKAYQKVIKSLQQALIDVIPFSEQFDNLFEQREHPTLKITSPVIYLSFETNVQKARMLYFKK